MTAWAAKAAFTDIQFRVNLRNRRGEWEQQAHAVSAGAFGWEEKSAGAAKCISHFSYCTIGAFDPPTPAVPIVRCCPNIIEKTALVLKTTTVTFLAERVGFEPTVGCPITSFQDWLLKPLGHLSRQHRIYHSKGKKSRALTGM